MLRTLTINLFALIVSFIIVFFYHADSNIQSLISENIIVLLFVFVISSISIKCPMSVSTFLSSNNDDSI